MKPVTIPSIAFAAAIALGQAGCTGLTKRLAKADSTEQEMTFSEDVAFLKRHVEVITLGQGAGHQAMAAVGISALGLAWLHDRRERFSNRFLRAMADFGLYTPLLFFAS